MKEYISARNGGAWHHLLLVLLCFPPMILAQTATDQGWEVNQDVRVNLFNRSPMELSGDSSMDALAGDALIPAFRSLTVMSPDVYGLSGAAEIINSAPAYGNFNKLSDRKYAMQLQARAIYSSYFNKGKVNFWLGALWQQQAVNSIITGVQADANSFGYNIGVDVNYADFSISGSYFDGMAANDTHVNPYMTPGTAGCVAALCTRSGGQGYVLKGFYSFTGATKFGISYGESSHYNFLNNAADASNELWTVGLYHDVNSWFEISAEYSNFKSLNYSFDEPSDMISIGGYIHW